MMGLEIELNEGLIQRVKRLAERHYGDSESGSIARVLEDALEVRLICLKRLEESGTDIEEPVSNWEPGSSSIDEQTKAGLSDWLFKKMERK